MLHESSVLNDQRGSGSNVGDGIEAEQTSDPSAMVDACKKLARTLSDRVGGSLLAVSVADGNSRAVLLR
jgi:hypothetical protein